MISPFKLCCFVVALLVGLSATGGLSARANAEVTPPLRILFLGDSLTAGYGILQDAAYPGLIGELARQDGFNIEIVNAGMSGDTSAGGKRRLPWLLKRRADIVFIALGANDGLRGLPVTELEKNLRDIIALVRTTLPHARIVLAGIEIPTNFGLEYTTQFRTVFKKVADESVVRFIPFLLQGVATIPEFNLPDGLHPNETGQAKIAKNIWPVVRGEIEAVLGK